MIRFSFLLAALLVAFQAADLQAQAIRAGSKEAAELQDRLREQANKGYSLWTSAAKLNVPAGEQVPKTQEEWSRLPDDYVELKPGEAFRNYRALFRVLQVIDKNSLLLTWGRNETFLFQCDDTANITDGGHVVLWGMVAIDGTHEYESNAGKRTVAKARFLTDEEAAERERKQAAEAFAGRWEKESQSWTDSSGTFTIEAVYDGYEGDGKIRLLKEDQSEVIIPLAKLSRTDRNRALELIKQKKEADEKKTTPKR